MATTTAAPKITIGLDVGDRYTRLSALDAEGEVLEESRIVTTEAAFRRRFAGTERARVVLEVGVHSAWMSRVLTDCNQEVIVGNPRKLGFIYQNEDKGDEVDAEALARVGRLDPKLLHPVRHRGAQAQVDLAVIRTRQALVRARTRLVNHVRNSVKGVGGRLPRCSTASLPRRAREHLPAELRMVHRPTLKMIAELTKQIGAFDKKIEQLCETRYPETKLLQQVSGVGPLTALCYVLVLEDPARFKKSRSVGAYVGLRPRRAQSGSVDPQLRITKAGDEQLRTLLVQAAHYILGPFGPDSDLRRWGLERARRGGKNAGKRAVVAVARKLAVLLHRLWTTAEVYEPLRNARG